MSYSLLIESCVAVEFREALTATISTTGPESV
jgi:hypothetical protein